MMGGLQRAGRQDDNDRTGMRGDDADTNVMSLGQEQDQPVAAAEVVFREAQQEREFRKVRSALLTLVLLSSATQLLWAMAGEYCLSTALGNVNLSSTCNTAVSSVCFMMNPKGFIPAHTCLIES